MKTRELKGFRVHRFDNEAGVLIPEGSIFMGFSSRSKVVCGDVYNSSWTNWAVPLSAYNITKKTRQRNKIKTVELIFELKSIIS